MKIKAALVLIFLAFANLAWIGPEFKWIDDQEQLLSAKNAKKLNRLISKHEKAFSNEILIHTCTSFQGMDSALDYGTQLGNKRGLGKKDQDNGIVIVVSASLRKTAICLGLGLEETITQEQAQAIIDNMMIPHFKSGNYSKGIKEGLKELLKLLEYKN